MKIVGDREDDPSQNPNARHAPADMMDETAAKTQALATAANKAEIQTNLANRAEGWTDSAGSHVGNTNGMFGEGVT